MINLIQHFILLNRGDLNKLFQVCFLGPFQTPHRSCAERNQRIKYGSRAAFESVYSSAV